ncbi:MAG: peptidylprolyl isomerase [Anaerolineales bacterium]|jgi:cyclophilin family peptidyl-prolyl cis-trans isomerase
MSMRKYGWTLGLAVSLMIGIGACGTSAEPLTETPVEPTEAMSTAADVEQVDSWDSAPLMVIDPQAIYIATLVTEKGNVKVELFADKAPVTVNNFIFLARQGYYDGITFHRVIPGFMAQSGDPTGTGMGGPGYTIPDEIVHGLPFDQEGLLAMANIGAPDTNGSQFFITYAPALSLNGKHTIFGKVIEGMDVLSQLTPRDPQQAPDFEGDRLIRVEIEQVDQSELPTPTPGPEAVIPQPAEGRPLADLPPAERENLFDGMPDMLIDPQKTYTAVIETSKGRIEVALDPLNAPLSVNNFVLLAELGYWDGFPIVAVEEGSFVLTGSPAGRPDSDVGYVLLPSENGNPASPGALGYWFRQDRLASSGSQFFITLDDLPGMEAFYTIFGYVTSGLDVAQSLTTEDMIVSITIEQG